MEEIVSLTLLLWQAMFLHIKPKLLASLYKGICLFKTAHSLEAFYTTRAYTKGCFLIHGLHMEHHKAKHPYLSGLSQTPVEVDENSAIGFHVSKTSSI